MVVVTKYPTTVVDSASAWTNPDNVKLDDTNSCASITLASATVKTLNCSGYGFAIPVGSTITQIRIFIDADVSRVTSVDDRWILFTLTRTGGGAYSVQSTNYAAPPTCAKATKDYVTLVAGWLTLAQLNAESFTTKIDAQQLDTQSTSYFCDCVGIEVTYTEPSAALLFTLINEYDY